ncbi:hypothetical protein RDWZM_005248 [Blomia tropicalis]|uniref:AB hydrolase-1 domain-containing protein n=1 Tax=Blomia tropicalis TaxID=40697 RepID=A0A9Q0M519_BLOTA|nr:hypothetical protein RDWZM_005248 [Blomia tropicalis]
MISIQILEFANHLLDQLIGFYLTNPRTLSAIVIAAAYYVYYLRNVVQASVSSFKPLLISAEDGGQISLDWYDPDGNSEQCESSKCESVPHYSYNRPIAIFLPGLTGCSQAEYIKTLVPMAHDIGYRAVCVNYRGLGNTRLLTPRLYCAANDDDLRSALGHIRQFNPDSKIVAIGISMGGIILARYLISTGSKALVDAAFLVSVCFNFMEVVDSMERGLNYPLNQLLTKSLINIVLEHWQWFQDLPQFDIDVIRKCRNIREFDEAFTIRMFNFKTSSDYYRESSHKGRISCIKKPTFCINAADDMFAPIETLPIDEVQMSSHVAMLVTARGGHIGFMESLLPRRTASSYYSERVVGEYLKALYNISDIRCNLQCICNEPLSSTCFN